MPSPKALILLPASSRKAVGGKTDQTLYELQRGYIEKPGDSLYQLDEARAEVRAALAKTLRYGTDLEKVLGARGRAFDSAVGANQSLDVAPLAPAILRYAGPLYEALDYGNLSEAGKKALQSTCVIVSGLFGALRPEDLIPDYRLPMSATLEGIGKLDAFWRPHLAENLKEAFQDAIVWSFLSGPSALAIGAPAGASALWRVRFLKTAQGKRRAMGKEGESLCGRIIRAMIEKGIHAPEHLENGTAPEGVRVEIEGEKTGGEIRIVRG